MNANLAMLGNSVSQIQNSLSSIENRLGNLKTLFVTASSLPDLTTMADFIQTEGDTIVPEPAMTETSNPPASFSATTPLSRPLLSGNSCSSISPLIEDLPVEKQLALRKLKQTAKTRLDLARSAMDVLFTNEEMDSSNYDGSRQKRKPVDKELKIVKRKFVLFAVQRFLFRCSLLRE